MFAYLRNREKNIDLGKGFDILVPNELMSTKFLNDIVQKWFITAGDSLLMDHKLFAELICLGGGVSLVTGGLTGENEGLGLIFGLEGVFRYLDLISGPYTDEGDFIVAVVSFILVELFLQL